MTAPTTTLYLKNLNERIPQSMLRKEIAELCKPHGPVLKIFTGRGLRKRGQAFVAFQELDHALEAQKSLDDRLLYDKRIKALFAHTPSTNTSRSSSPKSHLRTQEPVAAKDAPLAKAELKIQSVASPKVQTSIDAGPPNSRLLLQNIPGSVDLDKLISLCAPFPGYSEARMFAAKHVGFVDFESVEAASSALEQLSNKNIGTLKYAKK